MRIPPVRSKVSTLVPTRADALGRFCLFLVTLRKKAVSKAASASTTRVVSMAGL